ncbi:MAG: twin-arginine translocase subunit TatC [Candidatus Melainabacteria bacterium]|nr:MAG: twin-arginine translocase subunit TatC [Candidatus Melainabacteria bacterium]
MDALKKKKQQIMQKKTEIVEKEEDFISHLEALRTTILQSLLAILVLSPVGFFCAKPFINNLVKWSLPQGMSKLNYFSPMEVFIIELKVGLLLSFIFAFPFVVNRFWKFILPALHKNEEKFLLSIIFSSTFLFVLGVAFCVVFILPLIMNFSMGFSSAELQPMLGLNNFISLAGALMVAFGLTFQFPLLVIFAVYFDLISVESLEDKRPYVVVGILIIAALLTPPDIVSQVLLALPTYLLFEIGLLVAKNLIKKKNY